MIDEGQKAVEKASHIQQTARLLVEPELPPREDFEKLLQGTPATRQGDEAISEV
jgi:hypothetical protein